MNFTVVGRRVLALHCPKPAELVRVFGRLCYFFFFKGNSAHLHVSLIFVTVCVNRPSAYHVTSTELLNVVQQRSCFSDLLPHSQLVLVLEPNLNWVFVAASTDEHFNNLIQRPLYVKIQIYSQSIILMCSVIL